ncbi:hypothetical protein [Devosia beringensis]|uniref:hypothetical protein n=1 Tax=Devosia beringensis TaxID=2657486 RepID=UPI00186B58D3|nr:hypothetical protein [Devosia beringensis]
MQTIIVHNRKPLLLVDEMGLGPALIFEVLMLGMIVAPLLHCGLGLCLVAQLALGAPLFDGRGWSVLYTGFLVLGYGSTLAATILGLARVQSLGLMLPQLLLPLYWLLISLATISALTDLLRRPFYWFKSPHEPVAGQGR